MEKAPWVTYRPELKVLDCTIRDGGLINNHQFDNDFVKAVYECCVEAGLDYMEIGYRNSKRIFPKDEYGLFRHSDEEDIRRVIGDHDPQKTGMKLSLMMDAAKSDWDKELLPCEESVVDLIRVACYINQIPEAVEMINCAHERGYETSCNIMAISTAQPNEIDQALEVIATTPTDAVVVVDSFGALYREQVDILIRKYLHAVKGSGKDVGIHAHNNQQLAFANTIEAIILGANRVDASMGGMGRGAGNCPMELLIGFLRNPKFKRRPIYKLLQEHILKIQESIEWGPLVPYIISGQQNQHPREAMAVREGSEKDDYVSFFDRVVNEV